MNQKYVELQFGYGAKTHLGVIAVFNNRKDVLSVCGSRKAGTAKRVLGEANLATFADSKGACEKCLEKAQKVGA